MELHGSLLTRLRAFEAVARHTSFKRASEELHVTQSALSHHMRHLEEELGVELVRRMHRRIELTAEGQQLCVDCSRGFETLIGALRRLKQNAGDDTLTVSVAPYFSARWLTPRLGRWWARHPQIDLQLRHAYQPADFLHDRVHAGISWGHGNWAETDATLVLTGELAAVCSPAYLRKLRRKPVPADLVSQRLFCEFDPAHWQRWFEAARVTLAHKLDVVRVDDSHALRRTVIDGHGFALFFRGLLEEDLLSGQLVQPFDVRIDPGSAYYFVRPRGKPVGPNLAAFSKWLMDEMAENPFA
jgi:DNA-binding transcriptional LysR family regulator